MPLISLIAEVAVAQEPAHDASAHLCFRRPAGAGGWAVPLFVRQDGADFWEFSVGEQRCFDVTPGRHEFGAYYWGRIQRGSTRPAATVHLDIEAGDCVYLKVIMGFWGVLLYETDARRFRHTCDAFG
jgi:hypothetical protein